MPSLKQLEYFCELAKTGNMSKVAEAHFVSQTALSNSLSRLEKELNVQLFTRHGRNIVLNEQGAIFLQFVDSALNSISLGLQTVQNIGNQDSNNVKIAIVSSTLWGTMVGSFLSEHPQYSISQRECRIDAIAEALPRLDIDLIIAGSIDFNSPHLESKRFISDPVRLYVPPNHPFAGRKSMRLIEAKDEPFINQPKTTGFSRFCNFLFEKAGFTPNVVAECDYTIRGELLRKGVGVLLASDTTLRAHFFDDCPSILIEDDFAVRDMSCFWLKKRPLSPAAKTFLDFVVNYYSDSNYFY